MFLPVGDTPNPPSRPLVTWALIAVNVAVFLFVSLPQMQAPVDIRDPLLAEYLRSLDIRVPLLVADIRQHISAYDLFVFRHGFRPGSFSAGALLSAMFLHGGWMHLLGNMLFLWIFGDNVEDRLGHGAYLATYLGTGIASTLFFSLFAWGAQTPMIGASGAISGILGCYFFWFPRNQVKVFIFLFPLIVTTVLVPARFVLGFFLLVDNLLPFLVRLGSADGGGVAYGAHIGGFLAGMGLAGLLARRLLAPAAPTASTPGTPVAVEEIAPLIQQQQLADAAHLFGQLSGRSQRRQLTATDILAIARFHRQQGESQQAASILRRFISERPTAPELAQAQLLLGDILAANPRTATTAAQYYLAALDVARDPQLAAQAKQALRHLEGK